MENRILNVWTPNRDISKDLQAPSIEFKSAEGPLASIVIASGTHHHGARL